MGLAYSYAIFLRSLDVEIYVDDDLVGQLLYLISLICISTLDGKPTAAKETKS